VATAARNSTKADGDVIGGRSKQANGAIAVLALIAGRVICKSRQLFAGAMQCRAVQCGAVAAAAMPRALWGQREKRNLARCAVVGVR
jgi:hypothetical protein